MSFYARQMLNRSGPLGPQSSRQSSRNCTDGDEGSRGRVQRSYQKNSGGGGIARFSQPKQPQHPKRHLTHGQTGFLQNMIFQEEDESAAEQHFPIEGSIHAQREDRNFSQVTLSQLSDGPSVRSIRSQHSLSQRRLVGSRDSRGGSIAHRENSRTALVCGNEGVSGRRGEVNVADRHFNSAARTSEQKQKYSQSILHDADADADSLKSSQTLLSRPLSKDTSNTRPASSQSRLFSSKRSSSRGSEHGIQQCSSNDEADNSILSSQPLLSVAGNGCVAKMISQRQSTLSQRSMTDLKQQQPSSQFQTPGRLPSLPSLREHGRRHSTVGTTIRTIGAISDTLASLPRPSQALRSMKSMAIRTSSTLAALTPFRKGRVQGTIGSTLGTPFLSSIRCSSVFTPRRPSILASSLAVENKVQNASQVHTTSPAKQQNGIQSMDAASVPKCFPCLSARTSPSVEEANQSRNSRCEAAEPDVAENALMELNTVACVDESKQHSSVNPHTETKDTNGKYQGDIDDVVMDTNVTITNDTKTEELVAATRELKNQLEQLEKSKQEVHDMNERARQAIKEEFAKLEALQASMEVKYGTLQIAMDTFSTKIASGAHDHELTIRTLVNASRNELRQESSRTMEDISFQVHKQVSAQVPSCINALVETETRTTLLQMIAETVDSAKNDLQEWIDGVKSSCAVSGDGSVSPNALACSESKLVNVERVKDAIGNCEQGSNTTDQMIRIQSISLPQDDAADQSNDACVRDGNSIIQYDKPEKKNLVCDLFTGTNARTDGIYTDETPIKEIDLKDPGPANPEFKASTDTSPFANGEDTNNSSSTPIPRSSKSAWTTPFSRKATPLKNNYAKNKLPRKSPHRSRLDKETQLKLFNGFVLDKPHTSVLKSIQPEPTNSCPNVGVTITEQSTSLIASSSCGSMTKVNVVMKASLNEPKPSVERMADSTSKELKRKQYGHALTNINSMTVNIPDKFVVDNLNQKGGNKAEKTSKKRDQSVMTETASSPRRSKRLREVNCVEQMAKKGTNHKPSKVTPKNDLSPIVKYDWLDDELWKSDTVEGTHDVSKGYDSLLGTSVTVPTHDSTCCDDHLAVLDDDDNMELLQPEEKRLTLTSLLPFVSGLRQRNSTTTTKKSSKTFSKKRSVKRSPALFDFNEFNFS